MPEEVMTSHYVDGRRMGHIKEQKVERPAQRAWKADEVHLQKQSYLVGRIPAEVRNLVYTYLWEGSGDVPENQDDNAEEKEDAKTFKEILSEEQYGEDVEEVVAELPSTLSLLLTCRKIYLDAALFAFDNHTFAISMCNVLPTYHALTRLTSPLPKLQVNAVSRLAYDIPSAFPAAANHCAQFVTNSLLIFSALTCLEIRVSEAKAANNIPTVHGPSPVASPASVVHLLLSDTLSNVINGRVYTWQKDERWSFEWPQENHPDCLQVGFKYNFGYSVFLRENKSKKHYPEVPRCLMSPCACGCGAPCRNSAVLFQEGRRQPVTLRLNCRYRKEASMKPRVKQIPGLDSGYDVQRTLIGGSRTMAFGMNAEGSEFWKRRRRLEAWGARYAQWRKKWEPKQVWVSETDPE